MKQINYSQTNSSVLCSNAGDSKFSDLPENVNEGKLCQSLAIKLKRTGHTNYAVKLNSGALILACVASGPERRVFPHSARESKSSTKQGVMEPQHPLVCGIFFLSLFPIYELSECGKALFTNFLLMG